MSTSRPCTGLRQLTPYEPGERAPAAPLAAFTRRLHAERALEPSRRRRGHTSGAPGDPGRFDPRRARRILAAVLEVCDGRRAAAQLRGHLGQEVYQRLAARGPDAGERYALRTFHAGAPADDVVEAFGTVSASGGRVLAVAARFRLLPEGMRCTVVDLVGRRRPGPETAHPARDLRPRPSPEIRVPRQRRC
ncbi:hypothetical protein CFN78_09295 [Amycolatopsis antarctica]|uniref:Uncharacterized protein n=1 Tax=Amycolatopsis antarctica TaxID=1854586 RepID=A0A263D5G1_9PSEU|nr:Rv3235 family protein [Amycolatopsis antarctica]OZM73700.1 hypothetical protein CFN78_09295 [Amycolatopsis antarctica]